jgi:hypothetical protein
MLKCIGLGKCISLDSGRDEVIQLGRLIFEETDKLSKTGVVNVELLQLEMEGVTELLERWVLLCKISEREELIDCFVGYVQYLNVIMSMMNPNLFFKVDGAFGWSVILQSITVARSIPILAQSSVLSDCLVLLLSNGDFTCTRWILYYMMDQTMDPFKLHILSLCVASNEDIRRELIALQSKGNIFRILPTDDANFDLQDILGVTYVSKLDTISSEIKDILVGMSRFSLIIRSHDSWSQFQDQRIHQTLSSISLFLFPRRFYAGCVDQKLRGHKVCVPEFIGTFR